MPRFAKVPATRPTLTVRTKKNGIGSMPMPPHNTGPGNDGPLFLAERNRGKVLLAVDLDFDAAILRAARSRRIRINRRRAAVAVHAVVRGAQAVRSEIRLNRARAGGRQPLVERGGTGRI